MPRIRPEIAALDPYVAGRPIEEVVREYGIDPSAVIKLASNESPDGPFPGVSEAIADALQQSNRYPEDDPVDLVNALAVQIGVSGANLMFGNGSVALITDIANVVGGPGTNMVYGWPSFVMYRSAAVWAGSEPREVPLDSELRLDLDAMASAIDGDTTAVFICNPNNPTGTVRDGADIESFIHSVEESVLVVVDEAYHEYVDDPGYFTLAGLATEKPNVVVLRTFSKIFALAAFRIGYGVAHPDTVAELRKGMAPFTVNRFAQAAALASLGNPEELGRRATANAAGRHYLRGALEERGLRAIESQTNFVFFETPGDSAVLATELTKHGVIIRPMPGRWARVTVGFDHENRRFIDTLDRI